ASQRHGAPSAGEFRSHQVEAVEVERAAVDGDAGDGAEGGGAARPQRPAVDDDRTRTGVRAAQLPGRRTRAEQVPLTRDLAGEHAGSGKRAAEGQAVDSRVVGKKAQRATERQRAGAVVVDAGGAVAGPGSVAAVARPRVTQGAGIVQVDHGTGAERAGFATVRKDG